MSTCCTSEWVYPRGTQEYLTAEVETQNGILLDAQPVEFSLDGITWLPGTWQGAIGTIRDARTSQVVDFGLYYKGTYHVRVRVTDSPEVPIIFVGTLEIR